VQQERDKRNNAIIEQLEKLAELKGKGAITEVEYEKRKMELME
jgi:hypothetical protein